MRRILHAVLRTDRRPHEAAPRGGFGLSGLFSPGGGAPPAHAPPPETFVDDEHSIEQSYRRLPAHVRRIIEGR